MSGQGPAAAKTERLLNLVICLLYTRQPLSKSRIHELVPQYQVGSPDAFDRMFERDKDELRDLGIPLRTEPVDPFFDDEPGYRIDRREYALPEIAFEPDELAVLGLASRAWSQASLAGPAARALRKLEAAGVVRDEASILDIEPRVRTPEPSFEAVRRAVMARQPVRFTYRTGNSAQTAERHVQPWGLAAWHGRWYLTGHDTDRQAPRVFRLSRIEGTVASDGRPGGYEVPGDHEPRAMITTVASPGEPAVAVLRARAGAGNTLRRRARETEPDTEPDTEPETQGWSRLAVDYTDPVATAEEIAGFGPDVVVESPPELVEQVVVLLRQTLETHREARS